MKVKIEWQFLLYVAGQTSRSIVALSNLNDICEHYLKNRYSIRVIDLLLKPELAAVDQIVAAPTLVRLSPLPPRKIVGDLSKRELVLSRLGISS